MVGNSGQDVSALLPCIFCDILILIYLPNFSWGEMNLIGSLGSNIHQLNRWGRGGEGG